MSTFYLVLYIFIAVIVLLCIISFGMYLMHICGADGYKADGRSYRREQEEEQQPLNQGNISSADNFSHGNEQVALVNMKRHPAEQETTFVGPSTRQKHDDGGDRQQAGDLLPHKTLPPDSKERPVKSTRPLSAECKPEIPVKPLVHSLPSSKRNSVVKPSEAPPPPPPGGPSSSNNPTSSRSSMVVKPKAPPPPPPNTSDVSPPPTYNQIIYDTPNTGNFLSD